MQDQDDCSWHPVFMLCEWTTGGGILRKKTLNPTFWKDKWHLVFFIIGCRASTISCSNDHLQYGDDNCQLFLCFACSRVRWTWTQHGPVCLRTSNVFESIQTAGGGDMTPPSLSSSHSDFTSWWTHYTDSHVLCLLPLFYYFFLFPLHSAFQAMPLFISYYFPLVWYSLIFLTLLWKQ